MERLRKFFHDYFIADERPFDSRMLNTASALGVIALIVAIVSRLIAGLPFITIAPLLVMLSAIACFFVISVRNAGNASLLTAITTYSISIVFWPILFFTIGGHNSGMAVYFALAIILDFMLLNGKPRIFALLATIAVAVICYVSTIFLGQTALPAGGLTPYQLFVDIFQSILITGFLVGLIVLYKNRQHQNEKTRAEEARITTSAMFDSNPQINLLIDNNFRMIDCNPAAVEFFGYQAKEELLEQFIERTRKSIPDVQPDGRPSLTLAQRLMTAVVEGSTKFETELHVSEDNTRNLSVEFRRIPYGNSFAIVGYVIDMTEIHQRETELKQRDQQLLEAVEEARMANHAKSSFLATMSHEIRTPMNAIMGIAEIQLQNEALDPEVAGAFYRVAASGEMLLRIINDILDLSKIEVGKLELNVDKYDIASLLNDTAQLNIMRIGSKPIEFELIVDENVPAVFSGDALRVKQILNNILSNAFKYTAKGKVSLTVSVEPDDTGGDSAILVLVISDTGQGMTAGQVDMLFDKYARFNMEANRETEGTGLGMSITQNLIQLMQGDLGVKSEPGKGSVFTVRLPQKTNGPATLGKEMAENLHNFRTISSAQMRRVQILREPMPYGSVLIVDDVETNIYVAKGLLSSYKLKVDSADSGFTAIEKIKSGNVYDVVFMDHMMPKMDGIEATKIIRRLGYDRPIVALTANAVLGQSEIFLGNGFDDFISKPIDIRQMDSILQRLIRDKQPPEVIRSAAGLEEVKKPGASARPPRESIDPQFAEAFVRDAHKTLATLESISAENYYSNEDMQTYIINMHGIKSALANMGKADLSAAALKLETAGREGMLELVRSETASFISLLREFVADLTPRDAEYCDDEAEDKAYLREMLIKIKSACMEYDGAAADAALSELRKTKWSRNTAELLSVVSGLLLHSDFDEAADTIGKHIVGA